MTTRNRILIYDDYCPMCAWYTGMFVRFGLLGEKERIAFSDADPAVMKELDTEKGKNHIPLIDMSTGQSWYGIDALLEILGQKLPLVRTIGHQKTVKWCLIRLYDLISYNRKVIVAKKCGMGKFDCSPHFSVFYRILFMAIFLVVNSLLLVFIHRSGLHYVSFYHRSQLELQAAHYLLICCNILMAFTIGGRKGLEYLGQVNMLALIAVMMMIPMTLFAPWMNVYDGFTIGYLALVTIVVLREYFRRMDYAGITRKYKMVVVVNLVSLAAFVFYVFI